MSPTELNWRNVNPSFSDSSRMYGVASHGLSSAGNIFSHLRESILNQEQRAIDNAYRLKAFDEGIRQFGVQSQLQRDKLNEDIRATNLQDENVDLSREQAMQIAQMENAARNAGLGLQRQRLQLELDAKKKAEVLQGIGVEEAGKVFGERDSLLAEQAQLTNALSSTTSPEQAMDYESRLAALRQRLDTEYNPMAMQSRIQDNTFKRGGGLIATSLDDDVSAMRQEDLKRQQYEAKLAEVYAKLDAKNASGSSGSNSSSFNNSPQQLSYDKQVVANTTRFIEGDEATKQLLTRQEEERVKQLEASNASSEEIRRAKDTLKVMRESLKPLTRSEQVDRFYRMNAAMGVTKKETGDAPYEAGAELEQRQYKEQQERIASQQQARNTSMGKAEAILDKMMLAPDENVMVMSAFTKAQEKYPRANPEQLMNELLRDQGRRSRILTLGDRDGELDPSGIDMWMNQPLVNFDPNDSKNSTAQRLAARFGKPEDLIDSSTASPTTDMNTLRQQIQAMTDEGVELNIKNIEKATPLEPTKQQIQNRYEELVRKAYGDVPQSSASQSELKKIEQQAIDSLKKDLKERREKSLRLYKEEKKNRNLSRNPYYQGFGIVSP